MEDTSLILMENRNLYLLILTAKMSQIYRTRQGYINGWQLHKSTAAQPPLTEPINSLVCGLRFNKNWNCDYYFFKHWNNKQYNKRWKQKFL